AAFAAACGAGAPGGDADASATLAMPRLATVAEAFHTVRDTLANIDSPAVWHGPDGQHWVLSTAKATHLIRVEDAATGTLVRDVGGPGSGPGEFSRPNGIAVIDDFMLIVERDNARVQVFTLPDFTPIG